MPQDRIICPSKRYFFSLAAITLSGAMILIFDASHLAMAQPKGLPRHQTELRPNETLEQCLKRLNISDQDVYLALKQPDIANETRNLPTQTPVRLKIDSEGKVQSLKVPLVSAVSEHFFTSHQSKTEVNVLLLVRPNDQPDILKALHLNELAEVRVTTKTASFDGNFFNVMDRQEIPDAVSEQFTRLFSGTVNFSTDLNHGTDFSMKYEVAYLDGTPITTGRLLYGSINTEQNNYQGYWWQSNGDKAGHYYSSEGEALAALSWKSPILYSRKTSNFGMRVDPFTGNWANHTGIDIGAPTGTEVRATQQGKVKLVGFHRDYGKVVILDHANGYQTIYGHLSNFGAISTHQVVNQGMLIGYVGTTGRSTGPHLHYELHKDGKPINPEQSFRSNGHLPALTGEELNQFVRFKEIINGNKYALN